MAENRSERLWTPQEVADYLGVPKATLYRWRCVGSPSPPGLVIGRHLRFDPETVKAWAASRTEKTRSAP